LTYNISESEVVGTKATSQGVAEFGGANNELQTDLTSFGAATGLGNLSIDQRFGPPNDPQADLTEASLDIQYIAATGRGNTNWVWNSQDWMFEFATSLVVAADRPGVVSVSYAWSESEQCHGLPGAVNCTGTDNAGYINRTNFEFQKVGVLGTTVLVASGDSGAHGRTDKMCLFNPKMHPNFPAASPFVSLAVPFLLC
jgi:subtilase family serine protease